MLNSRICNYKSIPPFLVSLMELIFPENHIENILFVCKAFVTFESKYWNRKNHE